MTKKALPKKKSSKSRKLTKPYERSSAEQEGADAFAARVKARKPVPRVRIGEKDGVATVECDHPEPALGDALLMEALGTCSPDFYTGLMENIINVTTKGREPDERSINSMLAMVTGVKPSDEVEAMLAVQMAAIHDATMTMARRLKHVDTIDQQDSAERALNKLSRTFTGQVEALKRYRSNGQQKMTVEHVTVGEGGQAIIGPVSHGGGGGKEKTGSTS